MSNDVSLWNVKPAKTITVRDSVYMEQGSASLVTLVDQYNKWKQDHPSLSMSDILIEACRFSGEVDLEISFSYTIDNHCYDEQLVAYNEFCKKLEDVKRRNKEEEERRNLKKQSQKAYMDANRNELMKNKLAKIAKRVSEDPNFNLDRAMKTFNKKFKV